MIRQGSKGLKFRILFVALICFSLLGVMILRASQLQLFMGEKLAEQAKKQITNRITLPPIRGKIFDRNGEELAINKEAYSIYAQPPKILNPATTAKALAKGLKGKRNEIEKKLRTKRSFVWLERNVASERWDKISSLSMDGIGAVKGNSRYYPNMDLAGHLIGFAGIDSQGLEGIELEYNEYIKGKSGFFIAERDALGRTIFPRGLNLKDSSSGSDIVLTIDKTIQHIAERELGAAIKKYKAKSGTVLVMDPKTGEILAMAVRPKFNPNFFQQYNAHSWRNRVITDTFEPGSTFKIFLAAGAIESGKVNSQDIFYCEEGRIRIHNKYIHDSKKYGWLSVENILKVSSNIGAYKIAEKMGKDDYYQHILNFGFGRKSGIDFPGEVSGFLRPGEKLSPIGYANLAFGQGISVTSLQLVSAISAIANGGSLMKPYIVKDIINKKGARIVSRRAEKIRQVVSSKTAASITTMLQRVVSGNGTGGRAALDGYEVAGKTGTSQKFDIKEGNYSSDKYISSFIGFLPANNPKLAMLVVLDEPKDNYYGGKVAAPVFKKIAEQSLAYMKISPVEEKNTMFVFKKAKEKEPKTTLKKQSNMKVVKGGRQGMPDLTGLSIREILVKMKTPPAEISGRGMVLEQSPLPGQMFDKAQGYKIKLAEEARSINRVSL